MLETIMLITQLLMNLVFNEEVTRIEITTTIGVLFSALSFFITGLGVFISTRIYLLEKRSKTK